jgi:DNA primase
VLPAGKDPADLAVAGGKEAMDKVTSGKISLLGFELRQALAQGDTSTTEGRVRVFEEARRIMAEATSVKEREEEIPLLADRLRLTPESVALLLKGDPSSTRDRAASGKADTRAQIPLAERVLGGEASMERDFLVAVVCNLDRAPAYLEVITPEHFADPAKREVFVVLKEAIAASKGDREKVLAVLEARAREGSEAGPLFARLVMESDQGHYAPAVLEELHLRLQERFFMGAISRLRGSLESEDKEAVAETQRNLVRLERLLQTVRAKLTELDPDDERA